MESEPWMKNSLLAVNCVIMVYALVALIVDAVTLHEFQGYTEMLDNMVLVVPALTIAITSVAILVAAVGCITALKKSYCMGVTFCVMVSVILLIETLGGVTFYVLYLLDLYTYVEDRITMTRFGYNTSVSSMTQWDAMQRQFTCCGVHSARDWSDVLGVTSSLPMSCCQPIIGQIGTSSCYVTSIYVNKYACVSEVGQYVEDNTATSGYTMIGLVLLQIASIVFGSIFTHPLRNRW